MSLFCVRVGSCKLSEIVMARLNQDTTAEPSASSAAPSLPILISFGAATLALLIAPANAQSIWSSDAEGFASSNATSGSAATRTSRVVNGQFIGSDTSGNVSVMQGTGLTVTNGTNTATYGASSVSVTDGTNTTTVTPTSVTTGTVNATNLNTTNFSASNFSTTNVNATNVTTNTITADKIYVPNAAGTNYIELNPSSDNATFQGMVMTVKNESGTSSTVITDGAIVASDSIQTNNFTATGPALLQGGATVTNGLTVTSGGANITGNSQITGDLNVTGAGTFGNGVNVTGGNLNVTNTTNTGLLNVTKDASIGGNAVVTGNTTTGSLNVVGNANVGGAMNVAGPLTVQSLTVTQGSNLSFGNSVLHDVAAPVVGTDAANKAYVDAGLNAANRRIDRTQEGVALAVSLAQPIFMPGQTFAFRAGWGNFEGENAVGFSGAGMIGRDIFGPGTVLALDGGFGVGTEHGTVAGKAGITFGW